MKIKRQTLRQLAPFAFGLAILSILGTLGWVILNRQFDVYVQIGIALAAVAVAVGIFLDPDRVRKALTGRQAKYGSNALLMSLAFAGIAIVANYLAFNNPGRYDLTEDQNFSLAPETINTISNLDRPVLIKGFYTPNAANTRDNIRPLLDQYRAKSNGSVTYEFIDPIRNPVEADQLGVTRDRSLVVISGEDSEVVSVQTEQQITSAIIRVTNPGEREVAFLIGHGERDTEALDEFGYRNLRRALEAKNYTLSPLNLLAEGSIPESTLVVIVAGPTITLSDEEVGILRDFQERGGALVVSLDPSLVTNIPPDSDALGGYLEEAWGIRLRDDVVVDLNSILPFAGIGFLYGSHPITDELGTLLPYFPTVRSLELIESEDAALSQTALVSTNENSWGESDLESLSAQGPLEFNEADDLQGPLVMAAAVEDFNTQARLVVFGDSDFAANADFFEGANGDLMINSVDWAAGQEDLINLTPKQNTQRFVAPPSVRTLGLVFLLTIVVLPGSAILAGGIVWWRRRRQP